MPLWDDPADVPDDRTPCSECGEPFRLDGHALGCSRDLTEEEEHEAAILQEEANMALWTARGERELITDPF